VSDGDTITVLNGTRTEKIRLFGIDCPESDQDFGTKAKKFTANMVFGKIVEVRPTGDVSYGRTVAWVTVDGQSLNKELVRNGLAWWYRRHAESETELKMLEAEARAQKIGLWSHPHQIPPWKFRRNQN
jgi:micrococcal nuclease